MSAPAHPTLQRKLVLLVLAATGASLLLAAAAFLGYAAVMGRRASAQDLQALGQIVAYNAAPTLVFQDPHAAEQQLESLKAQGHITQGRIFDASGALFAAYPPGPPPLHPPSPAAPDRVWFEGGWLSGPRARMTLRIHGAEGTPVGMLFLEEDLGALRTRLLWSAGFILAVLLLIGAGLWGVVRRSGRALVQPILELAHTASAVSASQDYGLRVRRKAEGELGVLVDAFNGMLARIEDQDRRLAQHRENLEAQVSERTAALRKTNDELLLEKERAEASSRAKSTFLANMSHELRTPLNAILLYSELLREESEAAGRGDLLPDLLRIEQAGKHLLSLINDILDLSKIEAGRMTLALETFEVAPLVQDVLETVRPLAEQQGNTLEAEVAPDAGLIFSDATKVRQALLNLLSNACKFTKAGHIWARAFRGPGPAGIGEWLHLEVEDTGIGIAETQRERIFDEFIQAEESTTRQFGGTGLGLALTRKFSQMLGGDVHVVSATGRGSTFTLLLPLVASDPAAAECLRSDVGATPRGARILLIDDDPYLLDVLARLLARDGFRVSIARDGEEGLRMAREAPPDIVVLDVMMPRLDGWAVLKAMKADPALSGAKVVMLSILEEAERGLALGAVDYLLKPVDRSQLVRTLRRHAPGGQAFRVLVVEDDLSSQQGLQRLLLAEGMETWPAMDGREALRRLEQDLPGLILLDLMMPGMDGFEFLAEKQRHAAWASLPVVVLTARDLTEAERERLRRAQVSAVLQKGRYTRGELVGEIREAILRGSRQEVP